MLVYVVRRLLWAALLCIAMTFITFVIFFQIPSDPARFLVPNQDPAEYQLENAREKLGVDKPIYVQYGKFLWRSAHLDLGDSYFSLSRRREIAVTRMLRDAAPVTASLFIGAQLFYLAIAFTLGTLGALRPRSLVDRAGLVFVLLGISAHPVIVGLFLRQTFAYEWQLAPTTGYCPLIGSGGCSGPVEWAHHLLLPWLTFSLLFAALYSRMVRSSVLGLMGEHWVRTARAKGASEWHLLRAHVLRNALIPIVTMMGMDFGFAFGSAIFVEQVFGLPGLGTLVVTATRGTGPEGYDLPVILGVVLFVSIAVVVLNLVVDLLYAVLDPRIRVA
jgi:peptide/nickel transport system permease protein